MFLAYLAVAASIHASSPTPRFADVQIGTVSVRIPYPAGYCRPSGKLAATAQLLAAGDDRNVTLLTLVRCGDAEFSDYLIAKTPIMALNTDLDRPTLIQMASQQMAGPEFKSQMEAVGSKVSDRYTQVVGAPVKISAAIGPRGHDDTCVYMGGGGAGTFEGKSYPGVMGLCMTAVASRVINLHAYKGASDEKAIAPLLPFLRHWALQLKPTPSTSK